MANKWLESPYIRIGLIILAVVVGLALLSKWTDNTKNTYPSKFLHQFRNLIEQATRYHTMAKQDRNPIVSLMHADYALAYAYVTRSLLSESEIQNIAKVNISHLISYLEQDQQHALKDLVEKCPALKPEGNYAISSGWV